MDLALSVGMEMDAVEVVPFRRKEMGRFSPAMDLRAEFLELWNFCI